MQFVPNYKNLQKLGEGYVMNELNVKLIWARDRMEYILFILLSHITRLLFMLTL